MPSTISLLLHPERRRPSPEPLKVNLQRTFVVGIIAWAVALVVTIVLFAIGRSSVEVLATCLAGMALGGLGLLWERRNRRRYRGDED